MTNITMLTESELRTCIKLDREIIDLMEQAFARLADGSVIMPPVLSMEFLKSQCIFNCPGPYFLVHKVKQKDAVMVFLEDVFIFRILLRK